MGVVQSVGFKGLGFRAWVRGLGFNWRLAHGYAWGYR